MQSDLIKMYFPGMGDENFHSATEQMQAWSRFVDLLCILLADEKERMLPTVYDRKGLLFTQSVLVDVVAPADEDPSEDELYSEEIHGLFDRLYQKGFAKDHTPLFPISVVTGSEFSSAEVFAVILAAVFAANRKYERTMRDLCEEENSHPEPTIGFCADLMRYFLPKEQRNVGVLLNPNSYCNRYLFYITASEDRASFGMKQRLRLRDAVAACLLSEQTPHLPVGILSSCLLKSRPVGEDETICMQETYEELKKALSVPGLMELTGAEGSGRRFLLERAAEAQNKKIVLVDVKTYAETVWEKNREEVMAELVFLGHSLTVIPVLYCIGDPGNYAEEQREILTVLVREVPSVCIVATRPVSEEIVGGLCDGIYRITVPEASAKHQAILWKEAAKSYGLRFTKSYDFDVLVSKYIMSPGRIFETMKNTASCASAGKNKVIDEKILEEQIRRTCSVAFGETATRLSSPFTWGDLMLSAESEKMLRMASDRVRYRTTVNEDFGFAKKLPYGRGVAIVFYGPPGTGKTMAAQVLANDLGLDIYRIDLSQVSSKYIGETEKNLGAVFDAAKNSNAILFFDEADSLFSKRTQVSSSNDKYANAETSYLLQKIEEYTGVSVLATNNMQSFDAAFRRRMTFVIPIESPDEATRRRLWENVFPADAPIDEDVDLAVLAHSAELTGSAIKSAAVSAAYMAAAKKSAIGWEELIMAVEAEGRKTGIMGLGSKLRETMISGID